MQYVSNKECIYANKIEYLNTINNKSIHDNELSYMYTFILIMC